MGGSDGSHLMVADGSTSIEPWGMAPDVVHIAAPVGDQARGEALSVFMADRTPIVASRGHRRFAVPILMSHGARAFVRLRRASGFLLNGQEKVTTALQKQREQRSWPEGRRAGCPE
jgi:hypothetical protein